ncbi:MAG TPA: hypothetical protein ENH10_07860 [Bacteroidetes bacterium]|nr:hypothetical protein [Bacteroidota bacterium]HEX05052.1 hypothetical protein [Bacteroidota bacterium]
MNLRHGLFIALLLTLSVGVIQTVQAQPRGWERYYEKDLNHFVQFGLENGMNLSWGHRFGETDYLRYGLDIRISDSTIDDKSINPDTTTWNYFESEYYNFTIHLDYLKPVFPYEAVRLYIGAGPLLGFSFDNSEEIDPVDPDLGLANESYINKSTQWQLGARALIGGEYALNSRLSFYVEASLDAYRRWTKYEYKYRRLDRDFGPDNWYLVNYGSESEHEQWVLDLSNVTIGVTFRYGKVQ